MGVIAKNRNWFNFLASRGGSRPLAPTTDTTAGALTITVAMLETVLILRDPNCAARTDTTPT